MDNTNEPTVTIDIPSDPNATATMTVNPPVAQDAVITPEPLIVESNPQQEVQTVVPVENANPEAIQSQAVEANQPQNSESASTEAKPDLSPSNPPIVDKGGRPCEYCADKENIELKTKEYLDLVKTSKGAIPFIEELADKLEIDADTVDNWASKRTADGSLEHEQFFGTIKRIKNYQKLQLLKRTLGRYNPSGAIFQLKANHGLMESEKRILTGDTKEPLNIIITEEKKRAE
jgi:hypothetical protein